jgi:hypothetical protein
MPLYFFRIRNGRYSGADDHGSELAGRDAAWKELTSVCGDLIGSIARKLTENAEWQMELLDESRKPVFRIRVVAETLDDPSGDRGRSAAESGGAEDSGTAIWKTTGGGRHGV